MLSRSLVEVSEGKILFGLWRHKKENDIKLFFILVINQLDAQNLLYNKFISCLYIFRAACAHRQEVKIVL
jgi:hypothetical protein